MAKKLEVRSLRISFRTNSGTVKAVRDISFDLNKGETLAIVGESGSGKSVTAKSVLGILAGNSIVEGGEIIYDGRDLLKLTEEEFNDLRGRKISMIFQDPLSSLDPIMKIGKQMTEASLINSKASAKHGRKNFANKLKDLKKAMAEAGVPSAQADTVLKDIETKFPEAGKEYTAFANAREYAESAVFSCEAVETALRKNEADLIKEETGYLKERTEKAADEHFTKNGAQLKQLCAGLPASAKEIEAVLKKDLAEEAPDYYMPLITDDMKEAFEKTIAFRRNEYLPKKKAALDLLKENMSLFEAETLDVKACTKAAAAMKKAVDESIDPLLTEKVAEAAAFGSTMDYSLKRYAHGLTNNVKEEKRVAKETEKREKDLAKKGDAPKVVPAVLVDLPLTKETMKKAMADLCAYYEAETNGTAEHDDAKEAEVMVRWLEEQTKAMAGQVSKAQAYDKAVRIMEEVGIAQPRKRFEQYPFEFSGGMRQRIVIAIAVAANPDILICDEPTTALDVTIQAQILELINDLKRKHNMTVIFITHDLGVVANIADKVAVMYAGKLVEYGTADDVFYEPAHPYTWALLSSMPDLETSERLESIPGTPPNMIFPPKGDAFAARNKYALAIDFEKQPPRFDISETHWAATWLLHPNAPKVEKPAIVTERIARMKALAQEEMKND